MAAEIREQLEAMALERQMLIDSLPKRKARGLSWCIEHTQLIDRAIAMVFDQLKEQHPRLAEVDVVATGGYGRREMAPYSDVDITVIPPDDASAQMDAAIRALFQAIHSTVHDGFGLQVGYAYRLVADAPGIDAKTRTGLLDARLIWGSGRHLNALESALDETMASGEFILAKIKEREAAFAKYHDTPLVVEPQLKEGAGGLRCFHAANWIRTAVGEREAKPNRAFETLIQTRNLLHLAAGKAQDLLTRSRQAEICEMIDHDLDHFMEEVTSAAIELHRGYIDAKAKIHDARFSLSRAVVAVRGEARLFENADAGEAAVGIAIATELGLEVSELQPTAGPKIKGAAAVYAISTGERTVRNLDRCGLLKTLLPELTRCRTLMPHDNVHRFTVFEHTLQVMRNLEAIPQDSFLNSVYESLHDVEPLFLSALLHDVGKYDRTLPHSETGEMMAKEVCARWQLSAEISDTVCWLVRQHLAMMRVIQLRDIQNPETILEFAALVKDQQRLDLITLLTWADVNAVAEGAWSAAQEAFLQQLYRSTAHALEAGRPAAIDPSQHRQRLMRQLKDEIPPENLRQFVESLPSYYLASTPPDLVKLHYRLVQSASRGEPTVETYSQPDLNATDITICAKDEKGLLSRLLGILYAFDLSVLAIRACTTQSDTPVALDTFTVNFGGRPIPNATKASVSAAIMDVLTSKVASEDLMRERGKDPSREQQYFSYTFTEGNPGVLEVRAPRGRGMPYRLSRLIASQGWNTHAARVGQWADSGAATFYIERRDGSALTIAEVDAVLKDHR